MAPRFPQELFDLVIDECAAEGLEEWPYVPEDDACGGCCYYLERGFVRSCQSKSEVKDRRPLLVKLSLVSKSWNSRASKYLWWEVTIKEPEALHDLYSILTRKPSLLKLIKHVALHSVLDIMEWKEETILEDLAHLLAPIASFMFFSHDNMEAILDEASWDENELLVRSITPFCHSSRLTTLFYAGAYFPTQMLANAPNLRDFSLQRAESSGPEIVRHSTSFRLKRALFAELSNSVYETLLAGMPKAFSQLEKLIFEESTYPGEWVDEERTAQLLLLAKETVRQVYIGYSSPIKYLRNIFLNGSAEFPLVTHLTFKLEGKFFEHDHWDDLQRYFNHNPILCPKLQHLTIFINRFSYADFVALGNPDHIAWEVMRKYLGPDRYPALEKVEIETRHTGYSHLHYFHTIDEEAVEADWNGLSELCVRCGKCEYAHLRTASLFHTLVRSKY